MSVVSFCFLQLESARAIWYHLHLKSGATENLIPARLILPRRWSSLPRAATQVTQRRRLHPKRGVTEWSTTARPKLPKKWPSLPRAAKVMVPRPAAMEGVAAKTKGRVSTAKQKWWVGGVFVYLYTCTPRLANLNIFHVLAGLFHRVLGMLRDVLPLCAKISATYLASVWEICLGQAYPNMEVWWENARPNFKLCILSDSFRCSLRNAKHLFSAPILIYTCTYACVCVFRNIGFVCVCVCVCVCVFVWKHWFMAYSGKFSNGTNFLHISNTCEN